MEKIRNSIDVDIKKNFSIERQMMYGTEDTRKKVGVDVGNKVETLDMNENLDIVKSDNNFVPGIYGDVEHPSKKHFKDIVNTLDRSVPLMAFGDAKNPSQVRNEHLLDVLKELNNSASNSGVNVSVVSKPTIPLGQLNLEDGSYSVTEGDGITTYYDPYGNMVFTENYSGGQDYEYTVNADVVSSFEIDGNNIRIVYQSGNVITFNRENGYISEITLVTNNTNTTSDYHLETNDVISDDSFGGNQETLSKIFRRYLQTGELDTLSASKLQIALDILTKYYPNLSTEAAYDVITQFANTGCGPTSLANSILCFFNSMENGEEIFKEKFGYDMYFYDENGEKQYNYDDIAFDIWMYLFHHDGNDINNVLEIDTGMTQESFKSVVGFFEEKGIGVTINVTDYFYSDVVNNVNSAVNHLDSINPGDNFYILCAFFTSYVEQAEIMDSERAYHDKVGGSAIMDISSGHGTLITDMMNGEIIASSWGKPFKVFFDENDSAYIVQLHFEDMDVQTFDPRTLPRHIPMKFDEYN